MEATLNDDFLSKLAENDNQTYNVELSDESDDDDNELSENIINYVEKDILNIIIQKRNK